MVRFVLCVLGTAFSWLVTAAAFLVLVIGGVLWVYSRDLPSHQQLAQYSPKTISRIYDNDGRLMDEFAEERRIFQPIEDIPDLVKQAFISAEDNSQP